MLETKTLFGTVNKEDAAIERLRSYSTGIYRLAFSGGKESICIYKLAKLAGVRFQAYYNDTTVDPPELKRFIKKQYPQVIINRPVKSMFQLIDVHGPPMRNKRWCCRYLKERNPKNATIITGVRHEESAKRKSRAVFEQSNRTKSTFFLHPIIDWTELDVWEFIEKHKLPYCSLYDEGFDRIGCVLCPMNNQVKIFEERWPKMVRAYKRAFRKFYDRKGYKKWSSFDDLWLWWIGRTGRLPDRDQVNMFEN